MNYLLDTNIVSKKLLERVSGHSNFYILREVIEEIFWFESEIRRSGIQIVEISAEIIKTLQQVLDKYGCNLRLINLYSGQGTADVLMIAFILSKISSIGLFPPDEWVIVTKDGPLTKVANDYGIQCITGDEF